MKAKPYIGITAFKTKEEIVSIAPMFPELGFNNEANYIPMLGFLASYKRLADKTKEGKQSPAANSWDALLSYAPARTLPMMHYYTINKDLLAEEIKEVFSISNMYEKGLCRAVQLNMAWPPLKQVNQILKEFSELKIVLQLPPKATEGLSLEEIANRAKEYDNLVKYALIDPSRGKGLDFEVQYSVELMSALNQAMPNTRIGIAGGLGPDNVKEKVLAVSKIYKEDFCIDVQGRIRTEDKRAIDYDKARAYIKASAQVLL